MSSASLQSQLQRPLLTLATLIAVAGWIEAAVGTQAFGSAFYPDAVSLAVLAACGLCGAAGVVQALRGAPSRSGVTAFIVLGCLVGVAHLALGDRLALAPVPPLLALTTAAVMMTPLVRGSGISTALVVAWAVLLVAVRTPAAGILDAAMLGVIALTTGFTVIEGRALVRRTVRRVQETADQQWLLQESMIRSDRRAYERTRWSALIHDKVLGVLQLAARETIVSPHTRDFAGDALASLRGIDRFKPQASFAEEVGAAAHRLGLRLSLSEAGEPPPPLIVSSLADATIEAMTNVKRHAQTDEVEVRLTQSPQAARVTITDSGVGFAAGQRSPERAGIRVGIEARMRVVGGAGKVISTPGHGTTVALTWAQDESVQAPDAVTFRRRSLIQIASLVGIATASQIGLGLLRLVHSTNPLVTLALMAALAVATLATLALPARAWMAVAVSAVLVVVAGWGAVNLASTSPFDARYWFAPASATAAAILSFRFRPWAGPALLLAMAAATAVGGEVAGGPMAYQVIAGYLPPLVAATLGGVLRWGLNVATDLANAAARETGELRVRLAGAEVAEAEATDRRARLEDDVTPMLRHIARAALLDDAQRARIVRMEARTRDALVAPPLVLEQVPDAVERARDRGVRVDLFGREGGDPADLGMFRAMLARVLDACADGTSVRAQWAPTEDRQGSITVVGSPWTRRPDTAAVIGWPFAGLEWSEDEDSLVVEFGRRPEGTAAG